MEEVIKQWGGPRQNSGRNPIKDKKQPITVYLKGSDIKRKGGKEKVKALIIQTVEL